VIVFSRPDGPILSCPARAAPHESPGVSGRFTGVRAVACVGEAMVELVLDRQDAARVGFAGDVLNSAIYLHRALNRADPALPVSFVSALGHDALSNRMLEFIAEQGILTDHIARHPSRGPGLYAIATDQNGERSFTYWRSASAARRMFSPGGVDLDDLDSFGLVYLSAITLAILPAEARDRLYRWLAGYRARGGLVAFDSNFRPPLWEDQASARRNVARFWSLADIALPSLDDECALFGSRDEAAVIARLHDAGVRFGALKRAEKGPVALGPVAVAAQFAPAADVVDTTAAGDSFNAAFMAGALRGRPIGDCMMLGHRLAVQVIGHPGAIMPRDASG
jgi:2-dehydro-3-deoxygluconokinase